MNCGYCGHELDEKTGRCPVRGCKFYYVEELGDDDEES